jgi:hypothetical protein
MRKSMKKILFSSMILIPSLFFVSIAEPQQTPTYQDGTGTYQGRSVQQDNNTQNKYWEQRYQRKYYPEEKNYPAGKYYPKYNEKVDQNAKGKYQDKSTTQETDKSSRDMIVEKRYRNWEKKNKEKSKKEGEKTGYRNKTGVSEREPESKSPESKSNVRDYRYRTTRPAGRTD